MDIFQAVINGVTDPWKVAGLIIPTVEALANGDTTDLDIVAMLNGNVQQQESKFGIPLVLKTKENARYGDSLSWVGSNARSVRIQRRNAFTGW